MGFKDNMRGKMARKKAQHKEGHTSSEERSAEEKNEKKEKKKLKKKKPSKMTAEDAEQKFKKMDMDEPHLASMLQHEVQEALAWRKFKDTLWDMKAEMGFYLLFLGFLSLALFISKDHRYDYQLAEQMRGFLLDSEYDNSVAPNLKKTFYDIGGADDFWDYMNTVFIPSVFDRYSRTYCIESNSTNCPGSGFLLGLNYLLGPVRMRQKRWPVDVCSHTSDISEQIYNNKCLDLSNKDAPPPDGFYERVNNYVDETTQYPFTPEELHDAGMPGWKYSTSQENEIHVKQRGWIETYDGSGFVVDFSHENTTAEHTALLANLQSNGWIDAATSAIIIDLATYNPMINVFMTGTLFVEFLPVGGAYPFADIQTCRLFRYDSSTTGTLQAVFDVIVVIFVLGFLFQELYEFVSFPRGYISDFWNVLDMTVLLLFVIAFLIMVIILGKFGSADYVLTESTEFVPMLYYQHYYIVANNIIAFNSFLVWFKLFKYTAFFPGLALVSKTLARSFRSTVFFVVLFALVIIGFGYWGYQAFGDKLENYQSLAQSISSLLLGLLGGMDYYELYTSDRALGPLFFFTFTVLSIFVLLSMFFAILSEAYEAVKEEQNSSKIDIMKQLTLEWQHSRLRKSLIGDRDLDIKFFPEEEPTQLTKKDLKKVYGAQKPAIKYVYKGEVTNVETFATKFGCDYENMPSPDEQRLLEKNIAMRLPSSDDDDDEDDMTQLKNSLRVLRRQLRLVQHRLAIPKVPVKTMKVKVDPLPDLEEAAILQYSEGHVFTEDDEDEEYSEEEES